MIESINNLKKLYLPFRFAKVPFPVESIYFWILLFLIQKNNSINGNILEIGVENGGTAFLEIFSLNDNEHIHLVDIYKNDNFKKIFSKLEKQWADKVTFFECNSRSKTLMSSLSSTYRFIHIDGGHTYRDVEFDLHSFAPKVSEFGIFCFDDFFSPRWPDVSLAIINDYAKFNLVPFAIVNRKIYFSTSNGSDFYLSQIRSNVDSLKNYGECRLIDTIFNSHSVLTLKSSLKI